MQLRLEHHRDMGDPDDAIVENWQAVGVLVATNVDGEVEEEVPLVEIHIVRCPLGQPGLWALLDGISGDLAAVAPTVLDFDTGDPSEAVAELSGIGSHFLILNSVVCDKRFLGRQIGRWVAAEAIEAMSPGTEFVAALAAPLDNSRGTERAKASAKLRAVWASIGFVQVDDDVMVLNPGLKSTYSSLRRLQRRFGVAAVS